jgi:hypothetical protein
MKRFGSVALSIALLVSACGSGEMTLSQYVDRLNVILARTVAQGEELAASSVGAVLNEGAQLSDFTLQDLQIALERVEEIERDLGEALDGLEPPEAATDFHNRYFDTRFSSAREALAARASIAETWEELSETPEMAAYRTAVSQDKQTCIEFQADMDATGGRQAFADMPWLPNDLKEVVIALLSCDVYPDRPEDSFRP